jgi:aspartyl-tRNA(Asn)/glutamyl-tRNA(Gln) amidotransferase subunit C
MLTKETVEKVSTLARLKLTDAEITAISQQLSVVLENFEQIAQVNTKDVRPLLTPTEITMNLRPDVAATGGDSEKYLSNAPEKSGRLFRVPPVV